MSDLTQELPRRDYTVRDMTIREYMATQALAAIVANSAQYPTGMTRRRVTEALKLADELLRQLHGPATDT